MFFGTILWSRNGSPMIEPTVLRGFSEAYGILEDHLHVAAEDPELAALQLVMSCPSNSIEPSVAS